MSDSSSTHGKDVKYRLLSSFVEKNEETAAHGTSRRMWEDDIET